MSTRDLIDAIEAGEATAIDNAFNSIMASKVSEKLDAMRTDMAQSMFVSQEEVSEDEEAVVEEGTETKKKPAWLLAAELKAEKKEGKIKEEAEELDEKNWIAGAIKKPGSMTAAAKREGVSNSEYEKEHEHDSGKAGKRARLALTLKKLNK
jgi:hypothetical protein